MKTVEKPLKGHYDLYQVVTTMSCLIREQSERHPRTKVWTDLDALVEKLREIQADWADQRS
jgi:hypothetical protein